MANYKLTPDLDQRQVILDGLKQNGGHCPCIPKHLHNDDNICPCKDFLHTSTCQCGLFVKEE